MPPGAETAKPVAFRMTDAGAARREGRGPAARRSASLRLAAKIGSAFSRSPPSACDQRIDDREVACLHQRPIEHEGRDRPSGCQCRRSVCEVGLRQPGQYRPARSSGAGSGQGSSLPSSARGVGAGTDRRCRGRLHQVVPEPVAGHGGQESRAARSSGSGLSSPGSTASGMSLARQVATICSTP